MEDGKTESHSRPQLSPESAQGWHKPDQSRALIHEWKRPADNRLRPLTHTTSITQQVAKHVIAEIVSVYEAVPGCNVIRTISTAVRLCGVMKFGRNHHQTLVDSHEMGVVLKGMRFARVIPRLMSSMVNPHERRLKLGSYVSCLARGC
jgi:hypothetical protein